MIKAYAAMREGGKLKPYEYDPGPLSSQDVEIAVESCGICHSDLSMLNNDWGISQYPLVPGHEVIGTISAAGDQVTQLQPGQRVGLGWHADYCHRCAHCHSGDHNLCAGASGTIVGRHGGFAEQVRAHARSVIPLPDGVEPASAGPLFCGGITVFNPFIQYGVKPTDKVAVIGIGGLGHLALKFAAAWGCEVTAFTSDPSKADQARAMGAHRVINSRSTEELATAANRFDLIISTVNVALDWNAYLGTLKPKGRLHLVGAVLEPLKIACGALIGGQYSVSGSPVGSPASIATMLEFAARHHIEPTVETFSFAQSNEALAHLASGQARYRVVLKHP